MCDRSCDSFRASHVAPVVKNPLASTGDIRDPDSILGSGRTPEEEHGIPLQCACLENSIEEPEGLQSIVLQRVRQPK